jgi:type IV pilus assembly protein PilA
MNRLSPPSDHDRSIFAPRSSSKQGDGGHRHVPERIVVTLSDRRDHTTPPAATRALIAGFTLMEMVVVLAIIAVLALMSVPSITDRLVREQIVAALPLADVVKPPIASSWASLLTFPTDNADAGLPPPNKIVSNLVSSVAIRDGDIDITFGNNANGSIRGKILTLRPAVVTDAQVVPIAWICARAAVPDQMTVHGEDRTNIPANQLPVACRGP